MSIDSSMHCCSNLTIETGNITIEHNGLDFNIRIVYCSNCGSKKVGSGVSDGRKKTK